MRFSNLFPAAILAAVAFAAPLPTPGEIEQPDGPAVVPGKATWFCTYSYELVFDHYTLEGHKWGLSEKEVRKLIPGTVTAWEWEKIEPGWSDFRATVSSLFFLFCLLGREVTVADFWNHHSGLYQSA